MWGLFQFVHDLIWPPPAPPPPPPPNPAASYYGFQYVPGNGAPGTLDPAALNLIPAGAAGLYIAFQNARLADGFFRLAPPAPGPLPPVWGAPFVPVAPCAAITNLLVQLQANPPAGENWAIPMQMQIDLNSFLRYATWCLNLINQTAAGNALLTALGNGALQVIVAPFFLGNTAVAYGGGMPTNAVATTLRAFGNTVGVAPLDKAAIRAAIDLHYVGIGVGLPRYNQLAADIYATSLYSLFVDEANFAPNFLAGIYQYLGAPISGQNLMDWLSVLGFPAFEAWLANNVLNTGVNLRRFLCMTMTIILLDSSAPSAPGSSTEVGWNVLTYQSNDPIDPDWRPPAIGLAHELLHAFYNTAGTAPGYDNNDFSATAAELQVSGIIPFNGIAVSENQIRAQWAAINNPAPDPSNTNGGVIPRRTIYTPPVPPETAVSLRNNGNHI